MKHPTHEELISFLYEEVSTDQKTSLEGHLRECTSCRQKIAAWKETGCTLDQWRGDSAFAKGRIPFATALKYAAAAVIVLGLGFLGGRLSTSASDISALRAEMRTLAAQANAHGEEQMQTITDRLETKIKSAQLQTASDYASLRKELETVAVLTQASLQQAQQQIVQLAGNSSNPKP